MKPEPMAARDISRRNEPGNQSVHLSRRSSVQINCRLRSRNLPDVQCRWPKNGASAHRAQQKHSMKHMKTHEKLPLWSRRFQQGRLKKSEVSRSVQLHPMRCPWMPIDAARLPILTGWWEGVIGGLGLIRVTSALMDKPNIRRFLEVLDDFREEAWRGAIP